MAPVRPVHRSLPIALIELPFSFKVRLLVAVDELVELVEHHFAMPTPLTVFEHADILVTSNILHRAVAAQPASQELATKI